MQVAVAGVEDVADAQPGPRLEIADAARAPPAASCAARRRPARSSSATRAPSRRTPPCVRSRCARAARRSARPRSSSRRAAGRSSSTMSNSSSTSARRAVELDDEHRVGRGKFGCTAASAASIVSASIISTAAGMMPSPMISDTDGAAGVDGVERREQRLHRFGPPQKPEHGLRHDRRACLPSRRAGRADPVPACRAACRPMCTSSPSGSTASTPARDAR